MEVTAIKSCFSRPEPAVGNEQWNPHFHDNNAVKLAAATALRALNNKKTVQSSWLQGSISRLAPGKRKHSPGDFSGTGGASKSRTRCIPVKSLFKNRAAGAAPWALLTFPLPYTWIPLCSSPPSPAIKAQQYLCSCSSAEPILHFSQQFRVQSSAETRTEPQFPTPPVTQLCCFSFSTPCPAWAQNWHFPSPFPITHKANLNIYR